MSDRSLTALDRAILAYRANPTEQNRAEVLRLQTAQAQAFHRAQGDSFIRRTR